MSPKHLIERPKRRDLDDVPALRLATTLLLVATLALVATLVASCGSGPDDGTEDVLRDALAESRHGGEVVTALTAEPKTFQPLLAFDTATRAVLDRMHAGLVRLDHETGEIEPALAESWQLSDDGMELRFELRRGVRFSDGEPFEADDVLFTLQSAVDPDVGSPHAGSLRIDGEPIAFEADDEHTVEIVLPRPHPDPLRIFLGLPMLPSHLLAGSDLATAWASNEPASMAGLGPFRFLSHAPGDRLVLERNSHYWRRDEAGDPLPYLDRLVFLFVADETAKVLRFRSGDTHLLERIPPDAFADLASRSEAGAAFEAHDLGPGLGTTFVIFNLNQVDDPEIEAQQRSFRRSAFRRAVSLAIDRPAIARLVYQGRATPVVTDVSPANRHYYDATLEEGTHALGGPDLEAAGEQLRSAGFTFDPSSGEGGAWLDPEGEVVAFTLVTNTSNAKRAATAALIQEDLRRLGFDVTFVGIEFGDLAKRLTRSFDYDLLLLEFGVSDTDPSAALNVWRVDGGSHFFHLGSDEPAFPWEAEIDRLMRSQAEETDPATRRRQVREIQQIAAREAPFVFLVAPNVLVAVARGLAGASPTILEHPTLWNIDEVYWRKPAKAPDAEGIQDPEAH